MASDLNVVRAALVNGSREASGAPLPDQTGVRHQTILVALFVLEFLP